MHTDRFTRQTGLVVLEALQRERISVIGVGAIGRQVALQLVSMGARDLCIVDDDVVDESNVTTQGYRQDQIGQFKVEALAADLRRIDNLAKITCVAGKYSPDLRLGSILFACVDSIDVRKIIAYNARRDNCSFFVDGRMFAEQLRILTAYDDSSFDHYEETLFPEKETHGDGSCTGRSTIYSANIAAGLMTAQFAKWSREAPLIRDLYFSISGYELCNIEPATVEPVPV